MKSVLTALLAVCALVPAVAQDRGAIEGTVTDTTGSVVPAAKVRIVQAGTNANWSFEANDVGRYYAPNLPLGTYRVTVQKDGFSTATSDEVEIRSQTNVRVDIKLQVGAVAESVEVSSQGALLDTSTATVSSSIANKYLDELPNISYGQKADITNFLQYLPGFELTLAIGGASNGSSVSPVMNGSQEFTNEVFIDGAPASDGVFRGSVWENGGAIQHYGEFNIVTNSFSAEYGRTGTFFYSVSVKAGTNDLHGSIYDNFVNTDLNARDFFSATRQIYHQNGGGVTLGAPVFIPKVYNGRNKTFFFFGEDLFYSSGAETGTLQTIPTTAMRQGDFSNYLNGAGQVIPIFDPNSTNAAGVRTQFPNNQIPVTRFSKVSQNILAIMPQPDLPTEASNWHNRTGANPMFNNFTETARIDHSLSDKEKVYVSYTDEYRPRLIAGNGWGADSPLEGLQTQPLHSRTARLSLDSIFRPSLINHFTLGYDRYWNPSITNTYGQGWGSKLGLTGNPFDIGTFPVVSFSGGTDSPLTISGSQYALLGSAHWSLNDTVTWVKGHHLVKFGGSYWFEVLNDNYKAGGNGSWGFANTETSQLTLASGGTNPQYQQSGSSFASFLLGAVNSATTKSPTSESTRYPYQALFIQDEWHATTKLSLSLGLRWENNSPFYDKYDRWANFSPTLTNPSAGNLPGALLFYGNGGACNCKTTVQPWHKGFSPRVGYAYQIDPKLVMRGSLGIYYNAPSIATVSTQGAAVSASFPSPDSGFTPSYYWDNSMPSFSTQLVKNPSALNGQAITWYSPGFMRAGQVLSWTGGFQYQLSSDMLLDLTYLGHHGTHLESSLVNPNALNPSYLSLGGLLLQPATSAAAVAAGINLPWPSFGSFAVHTVGQALLPYPQYTSVSDNSAKEGIDRYNSLQAKVTKRFSKGLTMLASFAWSNHMTNSQGAFYYAGSAQNPFNTAADVAPSSTTIPLDFKTNLSYDLPFGQGKTLMRTSNPVLNALGGGWQIVFALERGAGTPLTITGANNLSSFGYGARANLVQGVPLTINTSGSNFNPATDTYINSKAFSNPSSFGIGNTARTLGWLRGFQTASESGAINKKFNIFRERAKMKIGADFSNPFNFVRWNNPVTSLLASNFGKVTGSYPGRRIQFTAEIQF